MYSRRKQVNVALEVATGYEELRPNQEAAIRNFLGGKDIFLRVLENPSATVYFQECVYWKYDELRQTLYRRGTTDLAS